MDDKSSLKEYPFPWPDQDKGYDLFPLELESDNLVFFHGTAKRNLCSIIDKGFVIPASLPSISFARRSGLALKYACEARSADSPEGCVLAVRLQCINKQGMKVEAFGLHVYKFDSQPVIIGYCVVPDDYLFV